MLENHLDGAHPAWVHASSVAVARNAPEPGAPGEEHYYDIAVRQMRQNGAPDSVWEATGMWTTPRGHGYMGDYHDDDRLVTGMGNPVFERVQKNSLTKNRERRSGPHPPRHAVEHDRLPELLVHEPVPAAAHHPPARGRPLGGLHLLATACRRRRRRCSATPIAFANVVNGTGSVGADRRPRGLRARAARPRLGRGRLGLHRPRPSGATSRSRTRCAARPARARSTSARRCAPGSIT